MLKKEFNFYLRNQDEIVRRYDGKHLVIVGEEVVGAYNSMEEAYVKARRKYEPGTFLIQKCTPGDAAYTWVFHSPCVSFA